MNFKRVGAVAGSVLVAISAAIVPAVAAENPVHDELRKLKQQAEEAFNKRDMDGLLKYVEPNVVATWQDATVARGHDGVRAYYEKMMNGGQSVVRDVQSTITVDELSHLYGDNAAVSSGDIAQRFELRDGRTFSLTSRWTATLVKDDESWRIATFHVSASVFDNPILGTAVRQAAYWTGGIAGIAGVAIGLGIARIRRRRLAA